MTVAAPSLARVDGVEIFAAGTQRGKTYTVEDLDRMVENFQPLKTEVGLDPTVVVGHAEDQSWLTDTGYPAAGKVARIWREGPTLFADFVQVPPKVAYLINRRVYDAVSSEIYDDYTDEQTGKRYGKALRRVALLGGELPQVKSLADVPLAYFGEDGGETPKIPPEHRRRAALQTSKFTELPGGLFQAFCEVRVMAKKKKPARKPRHNVAKFSERSRQVYKAFADEPVETTDAGAPPPAGVDRPALIQMLTDMGFDPSVLTDAVPDNVLAEIIRVMQSEETAPTEQPPADAVAATPAVDQAAQPGAAMSATPPIVPAASQQQLPQLPSQVVVKYSEVQDAVNKAVAAALAAELAPVKQDVAKFAEAEKKKSIDSRLDVLVKAGKVLPAERDGLAEQLQRANGVHKFSDGLTEIDKQFALLESRPCLVKFAEQHKTGKGGGKGGDDEINKVQRYSEDTAFSQVLRAAGRTPGQYVEGFKQAKAKKPDLTAASYGVPANYDN